MERSSGAELAQLLLAGFTTMVDEVITELERRGHPGVTATHEFALRAIDDGARSASDLGRRLGVSKQAAAKTITALELLGYLDRRPDPADARRKELRVTARGYDMTTTGGKLFDELRSRWSATIGARRLDVLEAQLAELSRPQPSPARVVPPKASSG